MNDGRSDVSRGYERTRRGRSYNGHAGERADSPAQIGRRGWWEVTKRVWSEIGKDNVSLISAGLALFGLLAAFPALFATVSIYGLVAEPEQIAQHIQTFAAALPQQATAILQSSLQNIAQSSSNTLSVGVGIGILLALWSARKGMEALMSATNIVYGEEEKRGFLKRLLVSSALTVGAVVGFVIVLLIAVAAPVIVSLAGLPDWLQTVFRALEWVVLWFLLVVALNVVYRYAPNRAKPKWRWVTYGAAVAAALWVIGSIAFSQYVAHFGNYGQTYGTLGGVVVLLLWFYLTGFVVLLGAELNAELERQTARDTTDDPRKPMGSRGAHMADTTVH